MNTHCQHSVASLIHLLLGVLKQKGGTCGYALSPYTHILKLTSNFPPPPPIMGFGFRHNFSEGSGLNIALILGGVRG